MEKGKTTTEFRKFELEQAGAQKVFDKFHLGEVKSISRFEQGMINDVYSLNGEYVLKVNYAHSETPKLAKEAAVYVELSKYDIPVPKLYAHEESKELLGYPYVLIEQLRGTSLREAWGGMEDGQREKIIFELGQLLGSVHNIGPDQISLDGQEFSGTIREDIRSRIAVIAEGLRSSEVLDEDLIQRIEKFYQSSDVFEGEAMPSLLHGNFVFGNIIVSDAHIEGVIDWEWAKFGHAEEELANVLYRGPGPSSAMGAMSEDLLLKFKEGYGSKRAISEEFGKRYLPYALLYFLKVLPDVPKWTHKPEKQKEYFDEVSRLIKSIGL